MKLLSATLLFCAAAFAQEAASDKLTIPFRDPSRAGTVRISVLAGTITVKGYSGREVQVEASNRKPRDPDQAPPAGSEGLRRINMIGTGLNAEEENNVVRISTRSNSRPVDLVVQVPVKTSLKLNGNNAGTIVVDNVEGDIEANHLNGAISLTGISGSVVAHSLNGKVTVVMRKADAGKPMSFSTLNGAIDVTLPSDLKADLKIRTERGEVYSDFDITPTSEAPQVEENKEGKGRYRVRMDSGLNAKLNGGGQEVTFKTMNGNVYIRKAK